ncbi:MAG TPA: hypothetical protein VEB22_02910 [Phycisphaerales bacterium]|nr:hypothetical protein [Phycisphaerales bacterium]
MAFLRQGSGLSALADPDPLPSAPLLERYLLQDPLPTTIFLVIAAVIGWWWLQRLGKARPAAIVAAACVLAAGGVLLLAKAVVTEREALVARCTELVNDVIAARAGDVSPVLRSDVTANVRPLRTEFRRDDILKMVADDEARRRGMTAANLKWVTATLDGPNVGRTQCRVQVQYSEDMWLPTTWMLHWTRDNSQSPWVVRLIDAQQIGFTPPQ